MVDSGQDSDLGGCEGSSILPFAKMQALGNDFVVVSEPHLNSILNTFSVDRGGQSEAVFLSQLARSICSRHFGVGADGLIVVRQGSSPQTLSWAYLNSDGSGSLMCGNGVRCLALFAVEHKLVSSRHIRLETGKGIVEIDFESPDLITSDLGEPILKPASIPVKEMGELPVVARDFQIDADHFKVSCASMGNPHCVIFESEVDESILSARAARLQAHPCFPESVNVEFVRVVSANHLRVIVFERGCGRTLACASGAAAVAVASVLEGRSEREVVVELDGGSLQVSFSQTDNHVRITGPARLVYQGRIDLKLLDLEAAKC